MTELLEQAIAQLKNLPATEQDAIAKMILEEIDSEAKWDAQFAKSQDVLAKLAAAAMAEYHAGKTQELDPDLSIYIARISKSYRAVGQLDGDTVIFHNFKR